ncbi:MAG TPA: response regulator [Candidatus Competibacteraceae bacterium]|nr:response regulator [Candidatus Competibacteraceae bacterium]MCP5133803.1 response regulator [Gammaproteobacteria bacterium]HPF58133.1 response regulator [Candidatus Competibacteraceae bacterium]
MAKQVLVVDDNEMITFLWKLVLENGNYVVSQVNDGASALEMLAANRYDCLIVDYHMDDMDGLALTEKIRAMPGYRPVPIIMIIAERDQELSESARIAGINALMTKPVHPDSLLDIIGRLCPLSV